MTHGDIAETLGIPVGTVKSRIRYGTAAMRAALEADDRVGSRPADGEERHDRAIDPIAISAPPSRRG